MRVFFTILSLFTTLAFADTEAQFKTLGIRDFLYDATDFSKDIFLVEVSSPICPKKTSSTNTAQNCEISGTIKNVLKGDSMLLGTKISSKNFSSDNVKYINPKSPEILFFVTGYGPDKSAILLQLSNRSSYHGFAFQERGAGWKKDVEEMIKGPPERKKPENDPQAFYRLIELTCDERIALEQDTILEVTLLRYSNITKVNHVNPNLYKGEFLFKVDQIYKGDKNFKGKSFTLVSEFEKSPTSKANKKDLFFIHNPMTQHEEFQSSGDFSAEQWVKPIEKNMHFFLFLPKVRWESPIKAVVGDDKTHTLLNPYIVSTNRMTVEFLKKLIDEALDKKFERLRTDSCVLYKL